MFFFQKTSQINQNSAQANLPVSGWERSLFPCLTCTCKVHDLDVMVWNRDAHDGKYVEGIVRNGSRAALQLYQRLLRSV
jgi:hypothetical protein